MAMVAASCGGGSDAEPSTGAPEAAAEDELAEPAEPVTDPTTVTPSPAEGEADIAPDQTSLDPSAPFAAYVVGPVAEAVAVIVQDHGEVEAFAVTMVALDFGYSLSQIVANPSIDATGTLVGVAPAGPALGQFESVGPDGFRSVPSPPFTPPTDRLSVLFDLTLVEIHTAAATELAEQVLAELAATKAADAEKAAATAARAEGARVLTVVLLLLAQGYSLEQVTQGIIFGDYEVSGGAACARLAEPPVGPRIEGVVPDCGVNRDEVAPAPADPVAEDPPGDDAPAGADFEEARYVGGGAFEETGDGTLFGGLGEDGETDGPPSEVLSEIADFVAGDTLSGLFEVLANVNLLGELDCFYLSYTFADIALVGDGTQTYSGTAAGVGAFPDEVCAGGPPTAGLQSGEVDVLGQVVGDTLTITLSAAGEDEPFVLTATRVES